MNVGILGKARPMIPTLLNRAEAGVNMSESDVCPRLELWETYVDRRVAASGTGFAFNIWFAMSGLTHQAMLMFMRLDTRT